MSLSFIFRLETDGWRLATFAAIAATTAAAHPLPSAAANFATLCVFALRFCIFSAAANWFHIRLQE